MDPTGLAKDAAYHNIIHMQSSAFKIQYDPIYKRSVAAYAQPCQPSRIEGAWRHGSMAPEALGAPPIFHSALPDRRCPCGVIRATFASLKACERSQKKRSEQDVGRCWEFEFDMFDECCRSAWEADDGRRQNGFAQNWGIPMAYQHIPKIAILIHTFVCHS